MLTSSELIEFESQVAAAFEAKKIRAPIHLSGGNEAQLIKIFADISPDDWVFSTWRSHYHALLHGVPRELVMAEILAGHSMNLNFPEYRFFTSAIVGGILPIACGVAYSGAKVWCFVGDMTASIGAYQDAVNFAGGHAPPITFVVEDNGLSTNSPTHEAWGENRGIREEYYQYQRIYPHVGCGTYVAF